MRLSSRFEEALTYAVRLHAEQLRKGSNIPYVAHLLGVAGIALQFGADEDEAIAAVLHDAVEDQGGAPTLAEIRRRFGDRVAAMVDGCTDTDVMPKPPWRERKEAYIAHLGTALPSVLLLSASDKLDNARSILTDYRQIGERVWEKFSGGKQGSLWYYRTLADLYRGRVPEPLWRELDVTVSEIERLSRATG